MDFLQLKSLCTQFQDVDFCDIFQGIIHAKMFCKLVKVKKKKKFNTRNELENMTALHTRSFA